MLHSSKTPQLDEKFHNQVNKKMAESSADSAIGQGGTACLQCMWAAD
jgi:hypothetical protein